MKKNYKPCMTSHIKLTMEWSSKQSLCLPLEYNSCGCTGVVMDLLLHRDNKTRVLCIIRGRIRVVEGLVTLTRQTLKLYFCSTDADLSRCFSGHSWVQDREPTQAEGSKTGGTWVWKAQEDSHTEAIGGTPSF